VLDLSSQIPGHVWLNALLVDVREDGTGDTAPRVVIDSWTWRSWMRKTSFQQCWHLPLRETVVALKLYLLRMMKRVR
jgi:hypothetical protein